MIWKLRIHTFRSSERICSIENFTNVTGKHLGWSLVCYEVFKNIYFEEHLQGAASGFYRPRKIDQHVPSKETSQISQNFKLILAEWRIKNEKFRNIKITGTILTQSLEYRVIRKKVSTKQVFLMKVMAITNNVVVCYLSAFHFS